MNCLRIMFDCVGVYIMELIRELELELELDFPIFGVINISCGVLLPGLGVSVLI